MEVQEREPSALLRLSELEGEDLSDEQIHELLRDAEERLGAVSRTNGERENGDTLNLSTITDTARSPAMSFGIDMNLADRIPRLDPGPLPKPYVQSHNGIAHLNASRSVGEAGDEGVARKVEDPIQVKRRAQEKKKATAGEEWFNMPRTDLTPELKRDLQLLQMRSVLDPHRHYKKSGSSKKLKPPEYSQVGTVVEGPTEFYSSRMPNKDRKRTFVEEVLAQDDAVSKFKTKTQDLRDRKASGKKGYYKDLKAKRSRGGR